MVMTDDANKPMICWLRKFLNSFTRTLCKQMFNHANHVLTYITHKHILIFPIYQDNKTRYL